MSDTTTPAPGRYVYRFGAEGTHGDDSMTELLGGKGAHLSQMSRIGLHVPPGIVVTTEACREYLASGNMMPEGLEAEVRDGVAGVERQMGTAFGAPPKSTGDEFLFPRRQPCVVVGTKIGAASSDTDHSRHHRRAIEATLPAFRS